MKSTDRRAVGWRRASWPHRCSLAARSMFAAHMAIHTRRVGGCGLARARARARARPHPPTRLVWIAMCAANIERAAKLQRWGHDARLQPTARRSVDFTWVLGILAPASNQESLNHAFRNFMTLSGWSIHIIQRPFSQLSGGSTIRTNSLFKSTQSLHMHEYANTCSKPKQLPMEITRIFDFCLFFLKN